MAFEDLKLRNGVGLGHRVLQQVVVHLLRHKTSLATRHNYQFYLGLAKVGQMGLRRHQTGH